MPFIEEEKIKILYEDSLKDIRELAGRMEGVANLLGTIRKQDEDTHNKKLNEIVRAVSREVARSGDVRHTWSLAFAGGMALTTLAVGAALGWGVARTNYNAALISQFRGDAEEVRAAVKLSELNPMINSDMLKCNGYKKKEYRGQTWCVGSDKKSQAYIWRIE